MKDFLPNITTLPTPRQAKKQRKLTECELKTSCSSLPAKKLIFPPRACRPSDILARIYRNTYSKKVKNCESRDQLIKHWSLINLIPSWLPEVIISFRENKNKGNKTNQMKIKRSRAKSHLFKTKVWLQFVIFYYYSRKLQYLIYENYW